MLIENDENICFNYEQMFFSYPVCAQKLTKTTAKYHETIIASVSKAMKRKTFLFSRLTGKNFFVEKLTSIYMLDLHTDNDI